MGHNNPFRFDSEYLACGNIREQLCGTPPIISMKCLEVSLKIFNELNVEILRSKSSALSNYFLNLMDMYCKDLKLISPKGSDCRGSHVSYSHEYGFGITQALKELRVIVDYREPNCIRFGFNPLYNTFHDIYLAVDKLKSIMIGKKYKDMKYQIKNQVT